MEMQKNRNAENNNPSAFHVHTFRCGHASEEPDNAYIEKAIMLGIPEITFTDHAPFPDAPFRGRMHMNELEDYISSLQKLRKEYQPQIAIKIGLETEWLENYETYIQSLKTVYELDLLLMGQHFAFLPEQNLYSYEVEDKNKVEPAQLAEALIAGMQTGLFAAVAHPDFIFRRWKHWNEEMDILTKKIWDAAIKTTTVMEINISSIESSNHKKRRSHFWPQFWKAMPDDVKVVYGLDAHSTGMLELHYLMLKSIMKKDIQTITREDIHEEMKKFRYYNQVY